MLQSDGMYFGMALAFSASLCWTFTPIFFAAASRRIGPYYVNVLRLGMAAVLLSAIAAVYVVSKGNAGLLVLPWRGLMWLALSGIAGLVVGDIFYLKALVTLGPRRTMQLFTLVPIIPVAAAWVFLGERLTWPELGGIGLIIAGIAYTTAHETAAGNVTTAEPGSFSGKGFIFGVTASAFQGIGAVLARQAFLSAPEADPIVATAARIVSAAIAIFIVATVSRQLPGALRSIHKPGVVTPMTLGAISGPVVGMLFYVSAFKYSFAGVATTFSSLSPLLILPVIALRYRVKISRAAIYGTLAALAGVAIIAAVK